MGIVYRQMMHTMPQPWFRKWGVLFVIGTLGTTVKAASVTIDSSTSALNTIASIGTTSVLNDPVPIFPLNVTKTATNGVTSETSTFNFSDNALSVSMSGTRGGAVNMSAESTGFVFFTVQPSLPGGNVSYTLSGNYSVTDVNSTAGAVVLWSFLTDETTATENLDSFQESTATHDETFALGQLGGDTASNIVGGLSGSLVAGDTYEWFYDARIFAPNATDGGASAMGNVTLAFSESDTVAVPLPAPIWSGMSLLSCMAGFAVLRRRGIISSTIM